MLKRIIEFIYLRKQLINKIEDILKKDSMFVDYKTSKPIKEMDNKELFSTYELIVNQRAINSLAYDKGLEDIPF